MGGRKYTHVFLDEIGKIPKGAFAKLTSLNEEHKKIIAEMCSKNKLIHSNPYISMNNDTLNDKLIEELSKAIKRSGVVVDIPAKTLDEIEKAGINVSIAGRSLKEALAELKNIVTVHKVEPIYIDYMDLIKPMSSIITKKQEYPKETKYQKRKRIKKL